MNWFKDIKTRKELKSKFRELAQANHPDHDGDTRVMQEIIEQYEAACAALPKARKATKNEAKRKSHTSSRKAKNSANLAQSQPKAAPQERFRPRACERLRKWTATHGLSPAIYRKPSFSHNDMCLFTASLFVYGRLEGALDIRGLYRLLCITLTQVFPADPAQTDNYRDYFFNRKVAKESLKKLRKTFLWRFSRGFWSLYRKSEKNLEQSMQKAAYEDKMPWSEPNPFTGACEWRPTHQELVKEAGNTCVALASYAWLFIYDRPAKRCFTFAERHRRSLFAKEIRSTYETAGDDIAAKRNRFFAETLEQHPNWRFRNPNFRG